MVAMEFVKDRESREPYPEFVASVSHKALAKGLLTVKAGVYNNVIRLLTPLNIPAEELKQGLDLLAESVRETQQELG
jgi:4-aminobutyrate aminotransferase/(S)-3-amino-2-methylpropionate transaminase